MSSLQNKLNNYEVVPPANVWDKIASSLDESELSAEFPSRLYEMQVTPPAAAWQQIDANLNAEAVAEAPVVSIKKRSTAFIRYAAAAVVLGFIAVFAVKFSSRTASTQDIKPDVASATEKTSAIPVSPKMVSPKIKVEDNPIAYVADDEPVHIASNKIISHRSMNASYDYSTESVNPLYAYADYTLPDIADRYIMLMTPEGNFIRVSKKLGNMVCCVSGEEQDADCKSQLKKWQEKLAASAVSSTGNFLDIVNMVNSLDDAGTEL